MTTIHVHGGLCNRLRAILSWRHACGPITVAWLPDSQVSEGRFSDAFQALNNVEFVDHVPSGAIRTNDPHPDAIGWQKAWKELRPIGHPMLPGPYAAIHLRRTDSIAYQESQGAYEPDQVFVDWAMMRPEYYVFLATDNKETQREITEKLTLAGRHVLTHDRIERAYQGHDTRTTSLQHAVWDLYSCVYASAFRGTNASSYSTTIATMRSL